MLKKMTIEFPQFSIDDRATGWNNPNKTEEQKQLLSSRGSLLNARMKYPLHLKIIMAKRRIQAAIDRYGVESCYIGFSGGKDSTILSHIVLSMGYKIEHVFSNTRLEYPGCVRFANEWCKKKKVKLTMVLPEMKPPEVWKKFGYPMFSKEIADILERIRLGGKVNPKKLKRVQKFMKYKDVPISGKCCDYLKKKPMKKWAKENGKNVTILGTRAGESQIRRMVWVRKGCVYVRGKEETIINPIIIFTEKDIKDYAKKHRIRFADIYYQGMERNGCYACGFGCHLADENNFIKLKQRNPALWKGVTNHLGFGKICKKCDIDYGED